MSNLSINREKWSVTRFDQMAECLTVRVEPSETTLERYVGLEHLDPETLKISRWGTPSDVIGEKLHFWPGDIIFGKRRAYQRKLAVADFEGICSAHAMVLRARPEIVLPEFLPFFMQSDMFFERALSISVGSLSPTINWGTLAKQEFPLPPLDEQRRIAEILWAADETIKKFEILSMNIETKYSGYLTSRFADTSSNWENTKINDVAEINRYTYSEKSTPPEMVIEYIDISCLEPKTIGVPVVYEFGDAPSRARRKVANGDILLSMVRPYFRAFAKVITDKENLVASTGICVLTPTPNNDTNFLLHVFFTKNFMDYCLERMTGTNYPAIKPSDISDYSFRLPPLNQQIEIASILTNLDKSKKQVDIHIQKIRQLSMSLINSTFS